MRWPEREGERRPASRRSPVSAAVATAILVTVVLTVTACGTVTRSAGDPPALRVVTGLYPLAQAIEQIGGDRVAVTDVVPAGMDPRTYELTPAQVVSVHHAQVVVSIGGFQPSLDAASTDLPGVLDLRARLGDDDPYLWLDPKSMGAAIDAIATVLETADPADAATYRNGSRAFGDAVASTGIDYESTLSVCPRRTIVTADGAFGGLAREYGLTDRVVGAADHPDPVLVSAAARAITTAGLTTAFSEPFVPDGTIRAVASAAQLKIRTLDPLSGEPPAGWPRQADYLQLMEANLGALSTALGCPDTSTGM